MGQQHMYVQHSWAEAGGLEGHIGLHSESLGGSRGYQELIDK